MNNLTNENLIDRMYLDLMIYRSGLHMYSKEWTWSRWLRSK